MARQKKLNVEIGGETWSYTFAMNQMCEVEEVTGKTVMEIYTDFASNKLSFLMIRAMLWVGLKVDEPKLTLEKVGNMMIMDEMPGYLETLGKAIMQNFETLPASKETKEDGKGNG